MSFIQRIINVQFNIAQGGAPFPGGGDQLNLSGLRISAKINNVLMPGFGELFMRIWGMTLSQMNHLSTLGSFLNEIPRNTITVTAGDVGMGTLPTVFYGTVQQAWFEGSRAPDIALNIEGLTLFAESALNASPISQSGKVEGAQVMERIAGVLGCTFDNSAGASFTLFNPYFWGSPRSQLQQCAKACGFACSVDNNQLTITPKGVGKPSANPLVISPKRGNIVGYPSFTRYGIKLKLPFTPNLNLQTIFTVADSQLTPANGNNWKVMAVDHDLEAMLPGGNWFTFVEAWDSQKSATAPRAVGF